MQCLALSFKMCFDRHRPTMHSIMFLMGILCAVCRLDLHTLYSIILCS